MVYIYVDNLILKNFRILKSSFPLDFSAFLIFFPTFSCGPIDRSRRFLEDYHNVPGRREYLERFGIGLQKLVLGAAYKFVFADFFYQIMNQFMNRTAGNMVCYAYSYGFYMFFDFAGYSLMAVGTAICLASAYRITLRNRLSAGI